MLLDYKYKYPIQIKATCQYFNIVELIQITPVEIEVDFWNQIRVIMIDELTIAIVSYLVKITL